MKSYNLVGYPILLGYALARMRFALAADARTRAQRLHELHRGEIGLGLVVTEAQAGNLL